MNILKKIFTKEDHTIYEKADKLVAIAHISAISSLQLLKDRYKQLELIEEKQWDFYVTVAGVFIAATLLNKLKLQSNKEDKLLAIITDKLYGWDKDSLRAFDDCKNLFEKEYDRLIDTKHDTKFITSDSLGIWIVWNILRRSPNSESDCELVRAVGGLVLSTFFNYWIT